MSLPFRVALEAIDAQLFNGDRAPAEVRVVTDTRTLEPGGTFLALRGERFDGHSFAREAVERGAAALIVADAEARVDGTATLVVTDTLRAYMALGAAARERFAGKILAVTGSAGKTTTKVFAAQLLATHFGTRVLATPANENNEIGVSKLLLGADSDVHDVLVVEMGARHYNDIAELVAIAKPHVGILTNIGDAHLEIMGSRERLEHTKWGLFSGGARAVLNAGDTAMIRRAPSLGAPAHWFYAADPGANIPMHGRVTALAGSRTLIDLDAARERTYAVDVRVPGGHNRFNLAAAVAAATELGVSMEEMVPAIPTLELPSGRYERIGLSSGVTLIYDAYNANAAGMIAALDAFATEQAMRRIALLGSMAELGEEAPALHERVGRHAAATNVDVMLVGGDFAEALAAGAARAGFAADRIVPFGSNEEAAAWLRRNAQAGDAVLLKGSRKYRLEEIVKELRR
jgi:UDP-N-acetylmuramoyl-tripeptide--D-alanyl-D-alanine ligase